MILARLVAVAALAAFGVWLKRKLGPGGRRPGELSYVQDSIDIDMPISTVYNQWTQFEEFPNFMRDVVEVRQIDDTHLYWRAVIAGRPLEWDAEITTQIPDRRISWRSTSGPTSSGAVMFDRVTDNRTRVTLRMSYRASGIAEKVGDALGAVRMELVTNLHRFAEFIQSRQHETGAWRGTVRSGAPALGTGTVVSGGVVDSTANPVAKTVAGNTSGDTTDTR
jgi:hypothetical protein